jgi:RNA polymerase sigma factor (sigma-70 family)
VKVQTPHRSHSEPLQAQVAQFRSDAADGPSLWARIYRTAFGIAHSEFHFDLSDAEDIGQEMALRAFQHVTIHGFNYSWIAAGTRFLCIDHLRTAQAQERAVARYGLTVETLQRVAAQLSERTADLAPALALLPSACRDLIHRYYWAGMTWAEIDHALNVGQRCSQYQMKKCLDALKRKIRQQEHVATALGLR